MSRHTDEEVEALCRALLNATNSLALVRRAAREARIESRGHQCVARNALDRIHDHADFAVKRAHADLGLPPE